MLAIEGSIPCHICTETRAHPWNICTMTGLTHITVTHYRYIFLAFRDTPLFGAARRGVPETLVALVERGADLHHVNKAGYPGHARSVVGNLGVHLLLVPNVGLASHQHHANKLGYPCCSEHGTAMDGTRGDCK